MRKADHIVHGFSVENVRSEGESVFSYFGADGFGFLLRTAVIYDHVCAASAEHQSAGFSYPSRSSRDNNIFGHFLTPFKK